MPANTEWRSKRGQPGLGWHPDLDLCNIFQHHGKSALIAIWIPACAGMTLIVYCEHFAQMHHGYSSCFFNHEWLCHGLQAPPPWSLR